MILHCLTVLKMSKNRPFSSLIAILKLFLYLATICRAKDSSLCVPSSCGNIEISYPFRLRTDPQSCGHPDPIFVLESHQNRAVLSLRTRRYHVEAISYNNFSIRLSDPGLVGRNYSSCPNYYSSLDYDDLYSSYMSIDCDNNVVVTFLNCLSPVSNRLYVENPLCRNTSSFLNSSRVHSYVTVGRILVSDLEESCTYDTMLMASSSSRLKGDNDTYSKIHDMLAYGVEVSWFRAMCMECEESDGTCIREGDKVRCRHYCYENTPLSEQSFGCKLEYYAPYLFLVALAIGALIGLRFVFGIPFLIGLVIYKSKRRNSSMKKSEIIEEILNQCIDVTPISYSYSEIKRMTRNFASKLGVGPHGTVFKGKLRSGPSVAVKMMSNSSARDKEFIAYVSLISRINHRNVAKMIGFCIEGEKRALVHEFVQCGSHEKHIFLMNPSLSFREMFKISLEVAKGIVYLHDNHILHLGVKPENILLDQDLSPKISDSGLEKLYSSDDRKGKIGFTAPEVFYKNIGEISSKADVYSYGILLLEMVSRIQSLNPYANKPGEIYFPFWIYKHLSEGKELEIRDHEEKNLVKKMVLVGLWCIQIRTDDRPTMNEVVNMLEGGIELLQMPPRPFQRGMDDEIMEKF